MAKYNYERYTINYGRYYGAAVGSGGSGTHSVGSTITGFRVLNINQLTGEITTSEYVNTTFTGEYGFYLYSNIVFSPGTYEYVYHSASGAWSSTRYQVFKDIDRRGSYVDTIIAEDRTYPDDWISGNYWYVKKDIAAKPNIISPNGGESITGTFTLSWTNDSEAIPNNYRTLIELSLDNGVSWRALATVNPGVTSYQYDFSQSNDSSIARIRLTHVTPDNVLGNADISDGVFSIIRNTPPKAPTLLNPIGIAIDRAVVNRISWRHNDDNTGDAQSKAILQWKVQGATNWNTINVNSNNNYYDVSANVFPLGQIVWRVKTYDQLNAEGPYSNEGQFTAADASDAPVITAPGNIVPIARPTVQWSSSDQAAYQIVILDSLNNVVWDSGEIVSTNKAATIGIDLANGGLYSIRLRTKNPLNLWTDNAILNITVAYTPPANPIINVVTINGGLKVRVEHPEPTGTQPVVSHAELYRSEDNINWIRIAENVGSYYDDYTTSSDKTYHYRVKAYGDTNTVSDSNVAEASVKLRGVWIHKANDPSSVSQFLYNEERAQSIGTNGTMMQFAGRKFAIAEYDESENDTFKVTFKIKEVEKLERLIDFIKSKETLCVRDGRGRKLFCHAFTLPIKDEFYGYSVDLSFERVSYSEVV